MKYVKFFILSAVSMFLFVTVLFVSDELAVNPHFTPISLTPQPFASVSDFKVAGIYWVPDYLKKRQPWWRRRHVFFYRIHFRTSAKFALVSRQT